MFIIVNTFEHVASSMFLSYFLYKTTLGLIKSSRHGKICAYLHLDAHTEYLTSSIFFCISFSWLSHSLLSTSNLSSSSAFSFNQSLSLCSRRQRRSMAVECVSARILRCSSLSLRTVEVSPCSSLGLRDAIDPRPAADWSPPLTSPVASLASN